MNVRDWFVMILTGMLWVTATVFLFWYHTDANFATWAALGGTVLSAYHWMVVRSRRDGCQH
jgi:hypothetical protein